MCRVEGPNTTRNQNRDVCTWSICKFSLNTSPLTRHCFDKIIIKSDFSRDVVSFDPTFLYNISKKSMCVFKFRCVGSKDPTPQNISKKSMCVCLNSDVDFSRNVGPFDPTFLYNIS